MLGKVLEREEYVEQAYFFRIFRERLDENVPSQEIFTQVYDEILTTTNLPKAIEFLRGEMHHQGTFSQGMSRLSHYFTAFQAFVIDQSEQENSRFHQSTALRILEREAEYRTGNPTMAGLFIYQFECISRNRLGYDGGMKAIAADPFYDETWRQWVLGIRQHLGTVEFASLLYWSSEFYLAEQARKPNTASKSVFPQLFGMSEGKIAKANRGKDPLYMFAALQRQLDYPAVPRPKAKPTEPIFHPALESRLQKLEKQLSILQAEARNSFDLSQFYVKPDQPENPS